MNAFLGLSDLMDNDDLNAKVKNKEKIVFATMKSYIPMWQKPNDWDSLSSEKKLERLEKLQEMAKTF
tara:strand:+ start:876 stop:1076 length:201 start_codon:yes stop_codon:yes gene_type:complete